MKFSSITEAESRQLSEKRIRSFDTFEKGKGNTPEDDGNSPHPSEKGEKGNLADSSEHKKSALATSTSNEAVEENRQKDEEVFALPATIKEREREDIFLAIVDGKESPANSDHHKFKYSIPLDSTGNKPEVWIFFLSFSFPILLWISFGFSKLSW